MRVAILVNRLSEYRLYGPLIDRALEAGWHVECWHNQSGPRSGAKAYLFPSVDAVPRFGSGAPVVRPYHTSAELTSWLRDEQMDAVLSIRPRHCDASEAKSQYPAWICVQEMVDTFLNHPLEDIERCTVVALHTPWWGDWAAAYYADGEGVTAAAVAARLAGKLAFIGFPELDARSQIEPAAVRARWGVPDDRPVVVLLPFPQGVGSESFWPKKIFGEPSRARRVMNVALCGQFRYGREALGDLTDLAVVRAIRTFCDRNGAFLLVKSREKTPIPAYTRALADLCVYDEAYYPPTILDALSIASLCISFYSSSVLEAAASAVPHVCIAFDAEKYLGKPVSERSMFRAFFTPEEGGTFHYPGVSRAMTIEQAVADLPSRTLDEFAVRADRRQTYMQQFVGADDGCSSVRLLRAIEAAVIAAPVREARVYS